MQLCFVMQHSVLKGWVERGFILGNKDMHSNSWTSDHSEVSIPHAVASVCAQAHWLGRYQLKMPLITSEMVVRMIR